MSLYHCGKAWNICVEQIPQLHQVWILKAPTSAKSKCKQTRRSVNETRRLYGLSFHLPEVWDPTGSYEICFKLPGRRKYFKDSFLQLLFKTKDDLMTHVLECINYCRNFYRYVALIDDNFFYLFNLCLKLFENHEIQLSCLPSKTFICG